MPHPKNNPAPQQDEEQPPKSAATPHKPGRRKTPAENDPQTPGAARARAKQNADGSRRGGAGMHLPKAAQLLICSCIVEGLARKAISRILVEAGYLEAGDTLSRHTFLRYTKDPRAQVKVQKLREDCITIAHGNLSNSVEYMAEKMHLGYAELVNEDGSLGTKDARLINAFAGMIDAGAKFFWDRFGGKDVLEAIMEAEAEEIRRVEERAALTQAERELLILQVRKEAALQLQRRVEALRANLDRADGEIATREGAPAPAPAAAAPPSAVNW